MVNLRNKKGIMLITAYLVIVVLLLLGAAFFMQSYSESKLAQRHQISAKALAIAEGGIERAMYDLRQDFENDPTPSWADGDINGMACGPDDDNFYQIPYANTVLGEGAFLVMLRNVEGSTDRIWIRSTGTVSGISRTIQVYTRMENINFWNNAIFAGIGAAGALINGNVDIRGSVHILGNGLAPTDLAMDMSGSAKIGNNYAGIPADLENRIPELETTEYNGEDVETLNTIVRIRRGRAGLSGTATIGEVNLPGNNTKETVDGVYLQNDPVKYDGNKGENNVYSDNGTNNEYGLGDGVTFPSLNDPYAGYTSYLAYLQANALIINSKLDLKELSNITPDSKFNFTDPNGKGSIIMDGKGNLTISGIVYIDGGNLNMNAKGPKKTINYTGKGALLATGSISINTNLLTSGGENSFPTNIIGFMTPNKVTFDASNINVMGIFYAEDRIVSQKQTNVAGTFASNYFDMGAQVPSIYQVPEVANNLPPRMIGSDPIWFIRTVSWQEV